MKGVPLHPAAAHGHLAHAARDAHINPVRGGDADGMPTSPPTCRGTGAAQQH